MELVNEHQGARVIASAFLEPSWETYKYDPCCLPASADLRQLPLIPQVQHHVPNRRDWRGHWRALRGPLHPPPLLLGRHPDRRVRAGGAVQGDRGRCRHRTQRGQADRKARPAGGGLEDCGQARQGLVLVPPLRHWRRGSDGADPRDGADAAAADAPRRVPRPPGPRCRGQGRGDAAHRQAVPDVGGESRR